MTYTGRLHYGPRLLSFDEQAFCCDLMAGGWEEPRTIEEEARDWLEQSYYSDEDAIAQFGDDAEYMKGLGAGLAEAICTLVWHTKGVHIPQKNVRPPVQARIEIDLVVLQTTHEVLVDLPIDHPPQELLPAPPLLLEDRRTRPPATRKPSVKRPAGEVARLVEQAIVLRRREGLALPAIAQRLHVSPSALKCYLRARGVALAALAPSAYRQARASHDGAALLAEAKRLRAQEPRIPMSKIAERLTIPLGTLSSYLSRAGVRLGPGSKIEHDQATIVSTAAELKRTTAMTQWQIAERLGISQGLLSRFMRDAGVPWASIKVEWSSIKREVGAREPAPEHAEPAEVQPVAAQQTSASPPDLDEIVKHPRLGDLKDLPANVRAQVKARPPVRTNGAPARPGPPLPSEVFAPRKRIERPLDPPLEPHIAVVDPAGKTLRYLLVSADGDARRALRTAEDWVATVVRTGAAIPGKYKFEPSSRHHKEIRSTRMFTAG